MTQLKANDLPAGKAVTVGNGEYTDGLIVMRHVDGVSAWLNVCPHQGRMLNYAPGKLLQTDDGNIVCAAHGAVFDQRSGDCVAGPCKGACLRAVAVRIDAQGDLQFNIQDCAETSAAEQHQ